MHGKVKAAALFYEGNQAVKIRAGVGADQSDAHRVEEILALRAGFSFQLIDD